MKKADLHGALRAAILDLSLAPGAALEEAALCATYGVSRTPLRETLQRLAGEGYVTLEANRGAAVSPLDLSVVRGLMQTAPMIYAAIARLATENAGPARVGALRDIQAAFRRAAEEADPAAMAAHNHRFHESIGEMAASPYLMPSLKRLLVDHTRMGRRFYDPRNAAERAAIATACDQHDAIVEAIAAHEPARAVGLTLDHWALARDRIESFVVPAALPLDPTEEIKDAV